MKLSLCHALAIRSFYPISNVFIQYRTFLFRHTHTYAYADLAAAVMGIIFIFPVLLLLINLMVATGHCFIHKNTATEKKKGVCGDMFYETRTYLLR